MRCDATSRLTPYALHRAAPRRTHPHKAALNHRSRNASFFRFGHRGGETRVRSLIMRVGRFERLVDLLHTTMSARVVRRGVRVQQELRLGYTCVKREKRALRWASAAPLR
jgi:hypothetical protein